MVVGLGKVREPRRDFVKPAAFGWEGAEIGRGGDDHRRPAGRAPKPDRCRAGARDAGLRAYSFDRYKTKRKEGEEKPAEVEVTIAVANVAPVRKAYAAREAVANGVDFARDLVNEPANVLYPVEFAERALSLKKLGVAVEVLDVAAMKKLGMNTLLGVAQGSENEPRFVVMRWNGGKKGTNPIAFIGKGVCFDTGGISIKPAGNMEDMKGDMAGAACVVGLMQALAARKAKVNVVGAIGIVENSVDGKSQRPGDIVTTMSGQTIEVINTDAEGRLVLPTCCTTSTRASSRNYGRSRDLTGAIIVALGHEYAGLFSNDDRLADRLLKRGGRPARSSGACRSAGIRQADRARSSPTEECGRPAAAHAAAGSCRVLSTRPRGRISTLRAPAWARRRTTSTRAGAQASAFGCSISWSRITTRSRLRGDDTVRAMTEVLFYHLHRQPIERVLPTLL